MSDEKPMNSSNKPRKYSIVGLPMLIVWIGIGLAVLIISPALRSTCRLNDEANVSATANREPNRALAEGLGLLLTAETTEAVGGRKALEDLCGKAKQRFMDAIKQAEVAGKDREWELAECYGGLAEAEARLGDIGTARRYLETAKEHAATAGDKALLADIEKRLATLVKGAEEPVPNPLAP